MTAIYVATNRPRRRMPEAYRVAAYWHGRAPFLVDREQPACFGCGLDRGRWSDLERAHLVDRMFGGLDGPQNLVMLCCTCHRVMPVSRPGQEQAAIAYVVSGGHVPVVMSIIEHQQQEDA